MGGHLERFRGGRFICGGNGDCGQTKGPTLHESIHHVVKMRLEQVRPDSAFWSSEMSRGVTWKPADSMRARVSGNDAGKMTVSATARALAACGSVESTSIHWKEAEGELSNHCRFARSVLRPRYVTADLRWRQPVTGTGTTL